MSTGSVTGVFIYCWGAGAGRAYPGAGSGGFAGAFYTVAPGTVLSTVVGGVSTNVIASGGGGSQGTYLGGGGFSGVFLGTSLTQAAALVIAGGAGAGTNSDAGGGGGGGSADSNATGTGFAGQRGYNWNSGSAGSPGGTLSAGGVGTNGTGTALRGASGNAVACGGGGYWGGGCGNNGGSGGGGGSSYISNACVSPSFSPGSFPASAGVTSVPCGSNTNTYYVSNSFAYGFGGSGGSNASPYYQGLVAIVPAVGTNPTYVGVTAKMLAT